MEMPKELEEVLAASGYIKTIRCKDCKYYDRQNDEVWEWGLCSRYKVAGINIAVNYDEYCSKAERKADTVPTGPQA